MMMADEEMTFQTFREILPQLEAKIRQDMSYEFEQKIEKIKNHYQAYAQEMVNKK